MAIEHGFGASVTNGLTFAYDTIDTLNSYLGEPTTNLVIAPDGNANVITTDVPPGVNVAGYAQYSDGYFVNPRNTTNTAATGRTFTYSVWMRSRTATPSTYLMYVFTGTGPDGGWWYFGDGPLTNQWTKYTYSRNDMTGTVSQVTVYRYNQQGTIEIAAPQIEINSHATQFVNGTRSATQGLLDLTGNSSIDLSTMSFNSAANLVFDGSNDYISLADGTKWFTNQWAYEMVLKFNGNTGTYQGLIWGEGDTGGGSGLQKLLSFYNYSYFHYRINNTVTGWAQTDFTPTGFIPTEYNHLVWQFNNGVTNLYINGTLAHTNNVRGAYSGGTNSPLYIGSRNDLAYVFNGELPVLKRYNRALSQAEVTQNFKKYQTRFGIA